MELQNKIDEIIKKQVSEKRISGMNVLVIKDKKEICYCEEGMADIRQNKPITRDSIFRLYSQTKPITAAAIMILMQRGELDLCQKVADFFPEFEDMTYWNGKTVMACKRPMLIHDLLRMTSGLVYPDTITLSGIQTGKIYQKAEDYLKTEKAVTTEEFVKMLGKTVLAFEPGSSWLYGTSADVAGGIIEKVSGMRFGEFLKKEIFDPLHMNDTDFWVPKEKQARLVTVYESVKTGDEERMLIPYYGNRLAIQNQMDMPPAFESGGAGLAGTLDDYSKFAQMLLNKGHIESGQILTEETVKYMTNTCLLSNQQEFFNDWIGLNGYTYGNFMRICNHPSEAALFTRKGEYGWDGWLGMYFANFPAENLTILIGTQRKDAGTFDLTRKIRNVILSSIE